MERKLQLYRKIWCNNGGVGWHSWKATEPTGRWKIDYTRRSKSPQLYLECFELKRRNIFFPLGNKKTTFWVHEDALQLDWEYTERIFTCSSK